MKEGPGSVYDKWNISMVICDTDSPYQSTKSNVGDKHQSIHIRTRQALYANMWQCPYFLGHLIGSTPPSGTTCGNVHTS
jgi:hypothetical protein